MKYFAPEVYFLKSSYKGNRSFLQVQPKLTGRVNMTVSGFKTMIDEASSPVGRVLVSFAHNFTWKYLKRVEEAGLESSQFIPICLV